MNRREFGKRSLATVATLALAPAFAGIEGCNLVKAVINPSTLGSLVSKVGVGVVALLTYLGKTALAQQVQADITTAVNDITSWTSGTVATNVINALNDVAAFISTIPGLSVYGALISLAVGTIDYVISLFTQNSPPAPAGEIRQRIPRTVTLTNPPSTPSQLVSQWNDKCKALNLQTVEIK